MLINLNQMIEKDISSKVNLDFWLEKFVIMILFHEHVECNFLKSPHRYKIRDVPTLQADRILSKLRFFYHISCGIVFIQKNGSEFFYSSLNFQKI